MMNTEDMQTPAQADSVAVGIMAYNEERNIGPLLDSLLAQTALARVRRIVVVASGCTDRTCEIVTEYCDRDSRITLVVEPARTGKVSAINHFLYTAQEEILVVSGADLILEPQTLAYLLEPFEDPEVGMTGAHPVPVNSPDTFFGYAAHLMWALHHDVALRDPKMGELIAFRNVFRRLDPSALIDELSVHQLLRSTGYRIVYAPQARLYNRGPETLRDFVSQRTHCIVGNLQIMHDHNVPVPTMRFGPVVRAAVPFAARHWRRLPWTIAVACLECYCRVRSRVLYRSRQRRQALRTWEQVTTTKAVMPKA
jgi:biofilm PGA synthesis N-glycosyltransferase PgaC